MMARPRAPRPFVIHKPVPVPVDMSHIYRFRCVTCGKMLDDKERNKRCKGAKR